MWMGLTALKVKDVLVLRRQRLGRKGPGMRLVVGGVDVELEATALRLMLKHGFPTTSSSSSGRKTVDQETQTELSGEVSSASKRAQNKTQGGSSVSSICGEGSDEKEEKGVDDLKTATAAERTMDEEEILELDAEKMHQVSEEAERIRQVSEEDGFRQDERPIKAVMGRPGSGTFMKMEDSTITALIQVKASGRCLKRVTRRRTARELVSSLAMNWIRGSLCWVLHRRPRHLSL